MPATSRPKLGELPGRLPIVPRGKGNRGRQRPTRLVRLRHSSPTPFRTDERTIASVRLAGIPIADRDVLELARNLRDAGFAETAETLEDAYDAERGVLALTIADREAILRALDDPPDGLAELRGCAPARARVARTRRARLNPRGDESPSGRMA